MSQRRCRGLAHKLDLFGANGRINLHDHESFEETDWAWLLLGAGIVPSALELQIFAARVGRSAEQVAPLRTHIERVAGSMPRHIEYVRHAGFRAGPRNLLMGNRECRPRSEKS